MASSARSTAVATMPPRTGTAPSSQQTTDPKHLKHKRRYCRSEGCNRIVKSQGLCQRHGAKPRKCKVEDCDKQAQGNFDRMCKSHFKEMKRATTPLPKVGHLEHPPPAEGTSVYDDVLPASIKYLPKPGTTMPLIVHLKAGFDGLKPPAWHRNEERRARGMFPIENPATQLEGWERELVWMEILVLTGASNASFRHLARAWGRDKGFHMVLAQFICERQGDVQRKKRQGDGKVGPKLKRPAKRRRLKAKNPNVISADIWDDSAYGDAFTNEALAADIFNFSAKEFEHVSSKWKDMAYQDSSEATSSPGGHSSLASRSVDSKSAHNSSLASNASASQSITSLAPTNHVVMGDDLPKVPGPPPGTAVADHHPPEPLAEHNAMAADTMTVVPAPQQHALAPPGAGPYAQAPVAVAQQFVAQAPPPGNPQMPPPQHQPIQPPYPPQMLPPAAPPAPLPLHHVMPHPDQQLNHHSHPVVTTMQHLQTVAQPPGALPPGYAATPPAPGGQQQQQQQQDLPQLPHTNGELC